MRGRQAHAAPCAYASGFGRLGEGQDFCRPRSLGPPNLPDFAAPPKAARPKVSLFCAESADEIRKLIGNAAQQVDTSAGKLRNVSASLDTIVSGVREVSGRLRLRQASADEAHGLVARAMAHIEQVGRERTFADFHDPHGAFIDRDLYQFVFDRNGTTSVMGSKPELVGRRQRWRLDSVRGGQPGHPGRHAQRVVRLAAGPRRVHRLRAYRREGAAAAQVNKPRAAAWAHGKEQLTGATVV